MLDNKIIALYERLSIEDADVKRNDAKSESNSIAHQRRLLFSFIEQQPEMSGMQVVEYKDDGYSGTNFNRPKFIELMSDVRKGKVAIIIVKDFSRLGRDYLDAGNFLDKIFPAYGVRFIAINDGYDSNSHIGQTTGLDVGLKNVVNDMYSKDISMKNKTAQMVRYKRGEHISAYPFYGYEKNPSDKHKLIVDPEAAEVVKRIFEYSVEGCSTYEIASILNAEGVLSPLEYKKSKGVNLNSTVVGEKALWNSAKIKVIIRDERYLGKMVSHKTESVKVGSKKTVPVPREQWIVVENTHEPIVSQELFDGANAAMTKRVKRAGIKGRLNRHNLFTCPYCNHRLQFTGGADNKRYIYCGFGVVNQQQECENLKLHREEVEKTVLYTINMIGNVYLDSVKRKRAKASSVEFDIDKVLGMEKTRLNALRTDRRNAYIGYTEGKHSREEYMKISASYNVQIQELEMRITDLETKRATSKLIEAEEDTVVREVEEHFFLHEYDNEVLNQIIDAIYVSNDGKIEVSFKRDDILREIGVA